MRCHRWLPLARRSTAKSWWVMVPPRRQEPAASLRSTASLREPRTWWCRWAGPDLVVVVTDGYENLAWGDLARTVDALAAAGVRTPVALCHSMFGPADDLALRRPAPRLPVLGFWHEHDFEDVLISLFSLVEDGRGTEAVREALEGRLGRLEREVPRWITLS